MKNNHLLRIIPVLAVLLALLCCGAAMADGGTGIPIDEAHFPDTDFRKYVTNNFDTDGDLWLNEDEIAKAENITIEEDYDVYSMEGIEYFTELTYILLDNNPHLKSIDLRANTKLTGVELFDNGLKEILLEGLTELTDIAVDGNVLAELDVSAFTLENLYCYSNPLRSLILGLGIDSQPRQGVFCVCG